METEVTIKSLYDKWVAEDRKPYEDRAEVCAKNTLPFMFPEEGFSHTEELPDNEVQSLGGKAVNHLAAKIVMALLPPAGQFFRYEPDTVSLNELVQGDHEMRQKVYSLLSQQTVRIHEEVKAQDIRTPMYNAMRMIIINGTALIEKVRDDGIRIFGLRSFVLKRDNRGNVRKMIFIESISKDALPDGFVPTKEQEYYKLYTMCVKEDNSWIQTQAIDTEPVGDKITYTDAKFPYQVLDWDLIHGEHYGRSYVSQNIGDIKQYQAMVRVLTEGSIIASKSIIFVNPLSTKGTRQREVAKAPNGSILKGSADDVTTFQLNKNYDFQVAINRLQELRQEIASAFLMQSSVQRDAERVTAEEIRLMAQELETSFAGIYSVLSSKMLKKIVAWIADEIGVELGDEINTSIIVGVDALSRSAESQKLDSYLSRMANLGMMEYINKVEVASRYATYEGIDSVGLLLSESEVQAELQKRQQAAVQQRLREEGAGSIGQKAGELIQAQQ